WKFMGKKTAAYRQVGNAFPPPVAQAVGEQIIAALKAGKEAGVVAAVRQPRSVAGEKDSELLFRLAEISVPEIPKAADRSSDRERAIVG
ncbi:DNA cytosine methyltransferase, partial [Streptomyces sp. SID7499]|nr:DNA cytosine methyltransferase [Streptomyces sp. SID7499]